MNSLLKAMTAALACLPAAAVHAQSSESAAAVAAPPGAFSGSTVGIVIVLAVVAAIGGAIAFFMRRRQAPSEDGSYKGYGEGYETIDPRARKEPSLKTRHAQAALERNGKKWSVPPDFDVARFLRKTKAYFMRLQDSWDRGDAKDIRRFTTRELYGQFCKQMLERGNGACMTQVVTLGAELESVETVGEYYIATVKFSGIIKEEDAEAAPFTEIWSLSKPLDGHRSWVLAGIQHPV